MPATAAGFIVAGVVGRYRRLALPALLSALMAISIAPAYVFAASCTPASDPPAPGIPLPGSCFEGYDGDQVDSDGSSAGNDHIDWQSVLSFVSTQNDDSSGGNDTQIGAGSGEETPDSWTFDYGALGSDKYDIVNGYMAREPNAADLILALGFIRASDNGTSHFAFELNQRQPGYRVATETHSPTNPARQIRVPTRTAGDVLITFSVDPPVIGVCHWSGNDHTGHWVDSAGTSMAGSNCPIPGASLVQGAMNASTITAANNFLQSGAYPLAAKTFAEATLNLTEALKNPPGDQTQSDPCLNFNYAWMHSRSSISITSNMQDYILPAQSISIATCGVAGKVWDDQNGNGLVDGSDFGLGGRTVFVDYDDDGVLDANEPYDVTAPQSALDLRPTGQYLIGNVQNGSWNVREEGQPAWACTAPNVPDGNGAAPPPECAYNITMIGQVISNNDFLNADSVPPVTSGVKVVLQEGGHVGSASVLVSWTASDNVTAQGSLVHQVQVRRWKGFWTSWLDVATTTGASATDQAALWLQHQYRVRTQDGAGNWSEWATSPLATFARRDDDQFEHGPGWTTMNQPGSMAGGVTRSSTADAWARLRFRGNGVAVVMPTGPTYGSASLCVDKGTPGEVCKSVELGALPSASRQMVAVFANLSLGRHRLTVTVETGQVDLDGAIVSY